MYVTTFYSFKGGVGRSMALANAAVCWRYFDVTANEFLQDLDDIRALIDGDASRLPRFMRTEPMTGTPG